MEIIICGEVLLTKNEWRISFKCCYCDRQMSALEELLRHTLCSHEPALAPDQLEELIKGINKHTESANEWLESVELHDIDVETFVDKAEEESSNETTNRKESIKCNERFVDDVCYKPIDDPLDGRSTPSEACVEIIGFEIELLGVAAADDENRTALDTYEVEAYNANKRDYLSSFLCEICGQDFSTNEKLQVHCRRHVSARTFACEYCDACFTFKSNYTVHRNRHLGIKPHPCMHCEKAFPSSTELKIHLRSHTGERPYVCLDCNKSFTNSAHLTSHRRRHSNERPHICNICSKAFYDRKLLRNHMPMHSDERPFACIQCNVRFKRRKALKRHLQLHPNIKQYCCKYCSKTFAQICGLHTHLKKAHADKT